MPDSQHDALLPAPPAATLRADYRPPAFLVDSVDLVFALDAAATTVRSRLALRRNPAEGAETGGLHLDGEGLALLEASLDGAAVPEASLRIVDGDLHLDDVPDCFELELLVRISPEANSELSGLYVSGGNLFTQCEAQGFRRITFFPDRPDVMTRFTTTLVAERARYPVLLSNGNRVDAGGSEGGRHWARWEDPHPKPSYLFALVAGDLVSLEDRFTTASGRDVALAIWVRDGDQDRCDHAMAALKASMRWDEETFGLEYDLDVFNIAAVSDFNMGAMENKGLNIFNTKYVLARPETATDSDYQGVETVIAHEYFHNWTGNRVTCRDWFQLSLKEGLTVFRDQEFSADQGSRAVKRVADVRRLRAGQFPEDAGPLAHPVRPDSYVRIDNFYTATIYQKGAEVVRMIRTLVGVDGFRRGMDLYFARHDNQAVTIEDFVAAMADASGTDLSAFRAWYAQAGTPEVSVEDSYDPDARRYTLHLAQSTPPTPGQPAKAPLQIPIVMALLGEDGAMLAPRAGGDGIAAIPGGAGEMLLELRHAAQDFVFDDVSGRPVPSLLRGFSAPVQLRGLSPASLRFLATHDTDPFVRWDSGQQYATDVLLRLVDGLRRGEAPAPDRGMVDAARVTLARADADPAFAAEALALPGLGVVADRMAVADHEGVHLARQLMKGAIGTGLSGELHDAYARLADAGPYRIDGESIGRRSLRNACLDVLASPQAAGRDAGVALAAAQFAARASMTDVLAALVVLAGSDAAEGEAALVEFHARWRHDDLVLDKWFSIQAMSPRPGAIGRVRALYGHPDFDLRNPNRMRSLIGAFASGNPVAFHAADGSGYAFLADAILAVDRINGQVAARMVGPLGAWRRQDEGRQALMRDALARVLAEPTLSQGTREMAARSSAPA